MSSADAQSASVNGNYATGVSSQQTFGIGEQQIHGSTSSEYTQQAAAVNPGSGDANISCEEIGWYFVEQYYTTFSKAPENLYLFYNRRSQFIMGTEAEKIMSAVGQKAIDDKIKDRKVKDAKVRITNVDTQSSGSHILIQVIGEIILNSETHDRKFLQTFVLAEQSNGYFVLNDIMRFLAEEDVSNGEADLPVGNHATEEAHTTEPAETVLDATAVDQAIKDVTTTEKGDVEPPAAAINGVAAPAADETVDAEEAPVAATLAAGEAPEQILDAVRTEDISTPEEPKDPEPTRAATPPKPAAAAAAAPAPIPAKPAVPKTWANLVAANRVALPNAATPAAPAAASTASAAPAPSQAKAATTAAVATPAAAASPVAGAASTAADDSDRPATPKSGGSEWQTAQRHDHGKKHQRPQSVANPDQNRGYIKNVGEEVQFDELKEKMAKFGELQYFDINRNKRCAFVDWKEAKGYQSATAANPHRLSNVTVIVEERHVKPPGVAANSGNFRGNFRGGARGNFQERGGRGGSQGRGGRGGAPANRGRGGAAASAGGQAA